MRHGILRLSASGRREKFGVPPIVALCVLLAGCAAGSNASGVSPPGGPSVPAPTAAQPTTLPAASIASPASSSTASVPVLGQSRGSTQGYGSVRPATISNGGDPTGIVMNVSWQSWGGPQAVGTGTGYYDPPNVPVDQAKAEQATVVAFDLGTCDGLYMYQAVEWYFPGSGGSFDASNYLNVCSWTVHPSGGP